MTSHESAIDSGPATGAGSQVDDAALMGLLADWLPAQRWFPGGQENAASMTMFRRELLAETADFAVELVLLHAETDPPDSVIQVLIGWRSDTPERVQHAIIGAVGDVIGYDALQDKDITTLILKALNGEASLAGVTAHPNPEADVDTTLPGRVLGVEQSNTSVVYGDRIIMKFFRRMTAGINPDAEVLTRLAHCAYIPQLIGEFRTAIGPSSATLALATRFLPNSADGWAMATTSVRDLIAEGDLHADEVGGDFAAEATRLGQAVAQVHGDLADAFGVTVLTAERRAALFDDLIDRAERTARLVPALQDRVDAILDTYRRLAAAAIDEPLTTQRIHGDLHLGQVLRTLEGWVVIDFEGEPSRPLDQRREHRSPLQDVAGMMRSLHYAAYQILVAGPTDGQRAYRAGEWAQRNRTAFLDGYAMTHGDDPRTRPALLTAFELDKAVYEVGYEFRHRPDWQQIPLAAITDLTAPG